jgi:hypothetical protein
LHQITVKEQAMSAEPFNVPIHGRGRDFQIPGDLTGCHAAADLEKDPSIQIWSLLPVALREGLYTE